VNFLLDTNIVSEWTKPRPNAGIVNWLSEADEDRIFISAITIAEIRYGIERLPQGVRRDRLNAWLTDDVPLRFEDRILPIDAKTGDCWGRVMARGRAAGRPVAAMDAFFAATSERYDLVLATRNIPDFEALGIRLINPWRDP
jgi:predicted nucleic acid-binding protein